ncbi:hypothetical protein PRJ_0631 [Pseudomonas sp. XWY-1]|nr:hypothetical protein PRJ_0631 [Pseudomonas sp. XWY-1]
MSSIIRPGTCKHRLLAEICVGFCGPFAGEPAPTRTDYWL